METTGVPGTAMPTEDEHAGVAQLGEVLEAQHAHVAAEQQKGAVSGFTCLRCSTSIPVGEGWNQPIPLDDPDVLERLPKVVHCTGCKERIIASASWSKFFPLEQTLELIAKRRKARADAPNRIKAVFASLNRRPTPPPARKVKTRREDGLSDEQIRKMMKGSGEDKSLKGGGGNSKKSRRKQKARVKAQGKKK